MNNHQKTNNFRAKRLFTTDDSIIQNNRLGTIKNWTFKDNKFYYTVKFVDEKTEEIEQSLLISNPANAVTKYGSKHSGWCGGNHYRT